MNLTGLCMAEDDTTKQVAGIRKRLSKKRSDIAEVLTGFNARVREKAMGNDITLRELLTNLRVKWREQNSSAPFPEPDLAETEINEKEST